MDKHSDPELDNGKCFGNHGATVPVYIHKECGHWGGWLLMVLLWTGLICSSLGLREGRNRRRWVLFQSFWLNVCVRFFSELQTCFHDQMQNIKAMLVAAIKIASLKKNLSKLQGVGLFQKWQGKVAHLAILIKRGRKKKAQQQRISSIQCWLPTVYCWEQSFGHPEVLCKWIMCLLSKGNWNALYSLYFFNSQKLSQITPREFYLVEAPLPQHFPLCQLRAWSLVPITSRKVLAFGLAGSKPDLHTDCTASITGDVPSTAAAAASSWMGRVMGCVRPTGMSLVGFTHTRTLS